MVLITRRFIKGIIATGAMTQARKRIRAGTARPMDQERRRGWSAWELICDEMLDTEHDEEWYENNYMELLHRGFEDAEIDAMRQFAWATVGRWNFDGLVWEWVKLDEDDIRLALNWLRRKLSINRSQHQAALEAIGDPKSLKNWYDPAALKPTAEATLFGKMKSFLFRRPAVPSQE